MQNKMKSCIKTKAQKQIHMLKCMKYDVHNGMNGINCKEKTYYRCRELGAVDKLNAYNQIHRT